MDNTPMSPPALLDNNDPLTPDQIVRRKEWTVALRSGDLLQGRNALMSVALGGHARYCCLGVACVLRKDIVLEGGVSLYDKSSDHPGHFGEEVGSFLTKQTIWRSHPPAEMHPVAIDLGLNVNDTKELARRNDFGETFAEIADYIDAETERRINLHQGQTNQ